MLHEIYKKLRIVPPVLLNYRYSVQVVEPLFLILYVHRAKTVEYIRAVTRKKVFMLHFQFIQVLSWYNPAVFNMPFFPAFFEFHCSGNLSRWPHSLGFSLLINITICFIRYVITWVRNIRGVTTMTGLLGDSGNSDNLLLSYMKLFCPCNAGWFFMCWCFDPFCFVLLTFRYHFDPGATSSPVFVTHTALAVFHLRLSMSSCPREKLISRYDHLRHGYMSQHIT